MSTPEVVERAAGFMAAHARLLERRLFELQFQGGDAKTAVDAVLAYRNPDGGFGHAGRRLADRRDGVGPWDRIVPQRGGDAFGALHRAHAGPPDPCQEFPVIRRHAGAHAELQQPSHGDI